MIDREGRVAVIWAAVIAVALAVITAPVFKRPFSGLPEGLQQQAQAFLLVYAGLLLVAALVCFTIGYAVKGLGFGNGMLIVRIGGGLGALLFLGLLVWLAYAELTA
jgi:hypothetical protein